MDAPYELRPWEIERLTDRQIIDIYYRKRDKDGNPVPFPKPEISREDRLWEPLTEQQLEIELEKARLEWWQVQFDLKRPESETIAKWETSKEAVKERILRRHGQQGHQA